MATRYIDTRSYATGYAVSGSYTTVIFGPQALVGGTGISVNLPVTLEAEGTVAVTADGAVGVTLDAGSLDNTGTIEATGSAGIGVLVDGGQASNAGLIEVTGDYSIGVDVAGGGFTNTGTIADISRVVRPILTLGTDQAAIAVTGDAMVTNAGFVEVMGGGQSTGAEVSAGTFINTGTIYEEVIPLLTYGTTRYAGYQFDSGVTAFGSGMVVNDGVIGNCTLHQGGVYLSGAAGLTNSGTIFAYGGFGLSATTSGTIVNSGTIYGSRAGAYLSSGAVLVNTGTISGSLEFKRKWFFRFQ